MLGLFALFHMFQMFTQEIPWKVLLVEVENTMEYIFSLLGKEQQIAHQAANHTLLTLQIHLICNLVIPAQGAKGCALTNYCFPIFFTRCILDLFIINRIITSK